MTVSARGRFWLDHDADDCASEIQRQVAEMIAARDERIEKLDRENALLRARIDDYERKHDGR